ncbi:hypothetical protein ACQY0O_001112 [Thecaphora frezii]
MRLRHGFSVARRILALALDAIALHRLDGPAFVVARPTGYNLDKAFDEVFGAAAEAASNAATAHFNAPIQHGHPSPPRTYSQGWMPPENVDLNAHRSYSSDSRIFYPGHLSEFGHGGSLHIEPVDYQPSTTFGHDGSPGHLSAFDHGLARCLRAAWMRTPTTA